MSLRLMRWPVVQQYGPLRIRSLAGFGVVCDHRSARSVAAYVWRLFAFYLLSLAHVAFGVFPTHQDRNSDRVFNFVIKCNSPDRPARV